MGRRRRRQSRDEEVLDERQVRLESGHTFLYIMQSVQSHTRVVVHCIQGHIDVAHDVGKLEICGTCAHT